MAVEIQRTALYNEVMDVYANCDRNTNVFYKAQVLCSGLVYDPIEVVSVMVQRDYADNFADEMSITLKIPLGKYAYKIYPNRTKLNIALQRFSLDEQGNRITDAKVQTALYAAVLIEEGPAPVELQGTEAKSEEALDILRLLDVKFQIYDQAVERMRFVQLGSIYRKTDVESIIKGLLTNVAAALKGFNKEVAIKSVEMVPANNQVVKEQIILPQGVSVTDVAGYLQDRYGVYNADLGCYVQDRCWYVYPLFDTNRYAKATKTLTIYLLPPNKFPEVERSYRKQGDSIAILSNNKSDFQKDNDINYIIAGNGVRYVDAGIVMEGYATSEGNKTTINKADNANEFTSSKQGSGLTNAPVSDKKITANPFVEFSKLARRKGGIFKATWINSDPGSLIPGMNARMVYAIDDTLHEAYGVLIGGTHITVKVGGTGADKHATNSMLYFFANLNVGGTE